MSALALLLLLADASLGFNCDSPPAGYTVQAFGRWWKFTGVKTYVDAKAECEADGTQLAVMYNWHMYTWVLKTYKCTRILHFTHNQYLTPVQLPSTSANSMIEPIN